MSTFLLSDSGIGGAFYETDITNAHEKQKEDRNAENENRTPRDGRVTPVQVGVGHWR